MTERKREREGEEGRETPKRDTNTMTETKALVSR